MNLPKIGSSISPRCKKCESYLDKIEILEKELLLYKKVANRHNIEGNQNGLYECTCPEHSALRKYLDEKA